MAVVIGEGRPYVTALIVPDWAAVTKQVPGKPEDLVHDDRVVALITEADELAPVIEEFLDS